jgi:hypothetical protein
LRGRRRVHMRPTHPYEVAYRALAYTSETDGDWEAAIIEAVAPVFEELGEVRHALQGLVDSRPNPPAECWANAEAALGRN